MNYYLVVCVTYDKTNRSWQETIGKVSNILFDNTPRLHLTKFSWYQSYQDQYLNADMMIIMSSAIIGVFCIAKQYVRQLTNSFLSAPVGFVIGHTHHHAIIDSGIIQLYGDT